MYCLGYERVTMVTRFDAVRDTPRDDVVRECGRVTGRSYREITFKFTARHTLSSVHSYSHPSMAVRMDYVRILECSNLEGNHKKNDSHHTLKVLKIIKQTKLQNVTKFLKFLKSINSGAQFKRVTINKQLLVNRAFLKGQLVQENYSCLYFSISR